MDFIEALAYTLRSGHSCKAKYAWLGSVSPTGASVSPDTRCIFDFLVASQVLRFAVCMACGARCRVRNSRSGVSRIIRRAGEYQTSSGNTRFSPSLRVSAPQYLPLSEIAAWRRPLSTLPPSESPKSKEARDSILRRTAAVNIPTSRYFWRNRNEWALFRHVAPGGYQTSAQ